MAVMPKNALEGVTTVYIAGPMRGIAEFNFPMFEQTAKTLRNLGYKVLSPHEHDITEGFDPTGLTGNEDLNEQGFDLRAALKWDTEAVLKSDAVCLLPNSGESKGAAAEVALAKAIGIPVMFINSFYSQGGYASGGYIPAIANKDEFVRNVKAYTIQDKTLTSITDKFVKGSEVRSVSSTGGEKGVKSARFDLIPVGALQQLAEHYGAGALKYDDNQWRKGYEYSKSYAAMQRHLTAWWGGEDFDEETGTSHLAAAAWHCFTLLTFMEDHPDFDDRYKKN